MLMRRLELLAPHKEAVRSLMRSARRDPPLALALNAMTVRSQQWMLTAAGIGAIGPKGMVRAQGMALLFANVLRTWVDDDDDQTRTLAALDRELARGQRFAGLLDDLCRIPRSRLRVPRADAECAAVEPARPRERRPRRGLTRPTRRRSSRRPCLSRAAKRQNFGLPSGPGSHRSSPRTCRNPDSRRFPASPSC